MGTSNFPKIAFIGLGVMGRGRWSVISSRLDIR